MTYSYYRPGGAMRAFALILASALIVALVWFVSYKNGCVSCSKTDSGTDGISCQACPDPNKLDELTKSTSSDPEPAGSSSDEPAPAVTESKKVSFEVVLDGRSTRFEVDVDNLGDHPLTVESEDGQTTARFEKGASTDIKVTIVSTEASNNGRAIEPQDDAAVFSELPEEEAAEDDAGSGDELQPVDNGTPAPTTSVQNNSDVAPAESSEEPAGVQNDNTSNQVPESAPTPTPAPINTLLPSITLLKGDSFGMDGNVLAIGRGCERRNVIIAVIPPEGNCLTLLCDTLCTQKTINEVKAKYSDRIAYTYFMDREYFVNLRGNSYFELYNCADKVEIQSGMAKPEWLKSETTTIAEDMLNTYIAKNELERFHVKGTNGCLVVCENDDVFRYSRA